MRKKQKLGQHLLKDPKILDKIVKSAEINQEDIVFEIGSGEGHLTEKLCASKSQVISVELDQQLFEIAKRRLKNFKNIELIHADGFRIENKFDILVSNIPYSKSLKIIEWISRKKLKQAIVTVQKEFAEKILAKPGSSNYRAVSVLAQYRFAIQKLFDIKKEFFVPPPKVSSAVLIFKSKRAEPVNPRIVSTLKTLFSFRGRLVSPAIKSILKNKEKELKILVDVLDNTMLQKRIERLNVDEAFEIARMLADINHEKQG